MRTVNTLLQANHEYRKTVFPTFGTIPIKPTIRAFDDPTDTTLYGYYGNLGHYDQLDSNICVVGTHAPIGVAELLPNKLGRTDPSILNNLPKKETFVWEKTNYSMFDRAISQKFKELEVKTILLTGVQTEWCITQTAIDYQNDGYNVIVVSDGVGSTDENEHIEALDRLKRRDILVTTCHGWIVDRLQVSDHPLTRWYVNRLKEGK